MSRWNRPTRRAHRDPVTPETRAAVIRRDGGVCVAPRLDPNAGPCSGRGTLDHVKTEPRMGKRAPSDLAHLVSLCERHHIETPWAVSNRPLLRQYLAQHAPGGEA